MSKYVAIFSFNVNLSHFASLLETVDIHMRVMMCGIISPYCAPPFRCFCVILNCELYNLSFLLPAPDRNSVFGCEKQDVLCWLCWHTTCITYIRYAVPYFLS